MGKVGWGIVAVVGLFMAAVSAVGVVIALVVDGPSFGLLAGAPWVLFWYWIGMGAWRRSHWPTHEANTGPRC